MKQTFLFFFPEFAVLPPHRRFGQLRCAPSSELPNDRQRVAPLRALDLFYRLSGFGTWADLSVRAGECGGARASTDEVSGVSAGLRDWEVGALRGKF